MADLSVVEPEKGHWSVLDVAPRGAHHDVLLFYATLASSIWNVEWHEGLAQQL